MAKLVSCKACGHQVAQTAKTCPNCGVKNPGMTWKQHLATAAFLIVITLIIMKACSSNDEPVIPAVSENQIDISQAQSYQLISKEDFGFPGRDRIQFNITAPEADTFESLAQTGIKAAMDYQKQSQAEVVTIFVGENNEKIDNGDAQAIIRYAPDGGGFSGDQGWKWEAEAIKPLTENEQKALELWKIHGEEFSEDALKNDLESFNKFAAQEIGIEESQISLRYLSREKYNVEFD